MLGWVLRRLGVVFGAVVAFSAGVLLRLVAGLGFAWTAVEAAKRGSIGFVVLATALIVLALCTVALEAVRVWAARKYDLSHD